MGSPFDRQRASNGPRECDMRMAMRLAGAASCAAANPSVTSAIARGAPLPAGHSATLDWLGTAALKLPRDPRSSKTKNDMINNGLDCNLRLGCSSLTSNSLSFVGDFTDTLKMKRRIHQFKALSIAIASLCFFASSGTAEPRDLESSRADQLAAAIYFEGISLEEIGDLSDADVARLIELLDDAAEIRQHPNILVALGISGSPAAFDAIADYALRGSSGELDRLEFRAQRSIASAMGHLARVDGRALAWLIRAATDASAAPKRSFRQLDPERIARLMRKGAITGLALSGQPRAARAIAEIIAVPSAPPGIVEHANEALVLHERMSREGPASVLRDRFGRDR